MKRLTRSNNAGRRGIPVILRALEIGFLVSLLVSCTKEDSSGIEIESESEPVEIRIDLSGIALYGNVTEAAQDDATRSVVTGMERVHFLEDFDDENMLETIIEAVPEAAAVPTRAANLTNTTMRVVVCNSAGNIVAQCVYNVTDGVATPQDGHPLVLPLRTGYTFHCYSPANIIDTDTKKVTVNNGDNFAYNKVTQVISSSNGIATVTIPPLIPMMSKIKYSVSSTSTEFSGDITCTGTVTGNFGTKGTWTWDSGVLTCSGTATQSLNFAENSGEIVVVPTGTATGKLTLTTSDVKIGGVDKFVPTLVAESGFTLMPGKLYNISIVIKKKLYIISDILNLKVATGNLLVYQNKWQIATDQGWYLNKWNFYGGDVFAWGELDPKKHERNHWGESMDVFDEKCVEVMGAGWRVPNYDDYMKFNNPDNQVWGTYKSYKGVVSGCYWGAPDVKSAEEAQDDYVFLVGGGHQHFDGAVYPLGVNYWVNAEVSSEVAYCILVKSNLYEATVPVGHTKDYGMFVRCVADK